MATVKQVKQTERRFDVISISNLGIQSYGIDNLYPQIIKKIVSASESASICMDRYKTFIQGNGFKDVSFSETVLNFLNETADDILYLICSDIANFRGFALHINYNSFGQISEIQHIPFENCRLCEQDSEGYVSKIAVHPDWTGRTKLGGKIISVRKDYIDYIDIFNPFPEVIASQIQKAGGIENYKGQILWVSDEGKFIYPKPVHDAVVSQMSTEEGLGNIANRNTRNNFFPFGIFITKKGQSTSEKEDENSQNPESISNSIAKLQGDEKALKAINVEVEYDEEIPKFERIQGNNYDKDFTVTTETATSKIYSAFNQEIWYRILNGSVGFSSQMITDAFDYYSAVTNKERRMIERAFDKIFRHFYKQVNQSMDFTIQPLKYVSSTASNNAG